MTAEYLHTEFMNSLYTLMQYQKQGFVRVIAGMPHQAAQNEANSLIAEARNATPEQYRREYRSVMQWKGHGYAWFWILK